MENENEKISFDWGNFIYVYHHSFAFEIYILRVCKLKIGDMHRITNFMFFSVWFIRSDEIQMEMLNFSLFLLRSCPDRYSHLPFSSNSVLKVQTVHWTVNASDTQCGVIFPCEVWTAAFCLVHRHLNKSLN